MRLSARRCREASSGAQAPLVCPLLMQRCDTADEDTRLALAELAELAEHEAEPMR